MANVIVEFMCHLGHGLEGIRRPVWLLPPAEDQEEWYDPDAKTRAGVTLPLSERDYLVPDAVVVLSHAELLARVQDIHTRHPFIDPASVPDQENKTEGQPYTAEALEQAVTDWIAAAGA